MIFCNAARPNPRCLRMYLLEKRLTLPIREIDVDAAENLRPEFIQHNPGGQVPVLILDDGFWLAETGAIFQYLKEKYPVPSLLGATPEERAETRMWQRRIERRITEPLYAAFHYGPVAAMYRNRMLILPECVPGLEKLVHDGLLWLDALLAWRTVIVPHRFTVVDIVLYTALDFGSRVGQPCDNGLRNLHAWFAAMDNRPSAPVSLHPKAAVTEIRY